MKSVAIVLVAALALVLGLRAGPAFADDVKPVLMVGVSGFDLEALQKMPVTEIDTNSPWTDGVTKFSGVSAKALLEAAGVKGATVKAVANDDYAVEIPREDLEKAIIAYKMDGALLGDQFGPYWIIYNYDDGLLDKDHQDRSVYKLKALEVK